ncbi:hypothetical protein Rsub_00301 [Raphidocelis subcapitata]|uniref:Uncharacterized protein n=1 Tax=Raphidocelis subcapitata TaxID=307507 RepID=A0A2V0NQ04_9CHLO|nr:hypothetical protein Rsub_00301 [Raphidocelis subcapitata]|eukprot:GBF87590.1 hypothetical protein Rsub_00301 [Raphidocelis subcapitata]
MHCQLANATALRPTARPRSAATRAPQQRPRVPATRAGPLDRLATGLAGGALALSLLLAPAAAPPPARAEAAEAAAPPQSPEQKEELVAQQRAAIEYQLEQGEIARRAELAGKKQALERGVAEVEDALQDVKAAEAIGSEAAKIAKTEEGVQLTAAKLEAQLEQEGIAEQAREVSLQQQLERATAAVKKVLGLE